MKRVQEKRHALGSDVLLTVVVSDSTQTQELFVQLWQEVQLFEATFSRFLPDSELTYVNQQSGNRVSVSPEFIRLAATSKDFSERTRGLYNPFVLPKLQAAGYKGSWPTPAVHEIGLDYSNREVFVAEKMVLGKDWISLPAESALDFGGIGKGYLLDQLAGIVEESGVQNYWFSLGGDILCSGRDVAGEPWKIGIQQAEADQDIASVQDAHGSRLAIATSGVTKRKGAGWHHIIDPRSGVPAQTDILTATVCSASGVEADVLAKCLVIVGSVEAKQFAREQSVISYLLQFKDKSGKIETYKTGEHIKL